MIKLCRVDHRLLHGQVAYVWCRSLDADAILIVSDAAAKDEMRMATMRLAKPSGIKLVIKSVEDSIKAINRGVTDKYKLLDVVESVPDAEECTLLREMLDDSVELEIRQVPEDKKKMVTKEMLG